MTAITSPARETTAPATRPPAYCTDHERRLEGGPITYRCPEGHSVRAADINREVNR